jgi:hypothetical protein
MHGRKCQRAVDALVHAEETILGANHAVWTYTRVHVRIAVLPWACTL